MGVIMANRTDGEGKVDSKGLEQGQQVEIAHVAPDGSIIISQTSATLKSVSVADVDLLLSFSDGSFFVIPNGAIDAAVNADTPVVFFQGNTSSSTPR
jgi:hypothetical protein